MSGDAHAEAHPSPWDPFKKLLAYALGIGALLFVIFGALDYAGVVLPNFFRAMVGSPARDFFFSMGIGGLIFAGVTLANKHAAKTDKKIDLSLKMQEAAQKSAIEIALLEAKTKARAKPAAH